MCTVCGLQAHACRVRAKLPPRPPAPAAVRFMPGGGDAVPRRAARLPASPDVGAAAERPPRAAAAAAAGGAARRAACGGGAAHARLGHGVGPRAGAPPQQPQRRPARPHAEQHDKQQRHREGHILRGAPHSDDSCMRAHRFMHETGPGVFSPGADACMRCSMGVTVRRTPGTGPVART